VDYCQLLNNHIVEMSTWKEKMAARAAARVAEPVRRGVRFIGNVTGNTNVAKSPTRKASPHHRNRNRTHRTLKITNAISPVGSPPQRPGRGARKFRAAVTRHLRGKNKKIHTSRKAYHKGRKATRRHKRRLHKH
jgi:hypothetical protein